MTDLLTMTMTTALKGAGYVSVDEDVGVVADKVLRNKKMVFVVAKTVADMADWHLVRIEKDGTLTFARWSAEKCELLATTPVGMFLAAAHCKPSCLDWFLAAAAAQVRKD